MFTEIVFGTGTQNLILDILAIVVKLGILLIALIFFQRLYAEIAKNSADGHPEKTILVLRTTLTAFAFAVLALNWLPWLYGATGSQNAYDLAVGEGQYALAVPLVFILMVIIAVWRRSPNSPTLVAPLFAAYALSIVAIGLTSAAYRDAHAVGPAWLSLIAAAIAIFPAILYAEGMPHPTNRLLYRFINLGKVRYDEAVHYAAQNLHISYKGSNVPIGFSAAEGEYQGKVVQIYGAEGSLSNNKIAGIMTGADFKVDDTIINRPHAWPEVYFKALRLELPRWYVELAEDENWEPDLKRLEIEIDGIQIEDEYEIASPNEKKALEIAEKLREEIIDLDAEFILLNHDGVFVGYDFSRMRMPVEYLFEKIKLQLSMAEQIGKILAPAKADKKQPAPRKTAEDKITKAKEAKPKQAQDKTIKSKARKKGTTAHSGQKDPASNSVPNSV
ncbi:MAG: hypothetical protein QME41_04805 [Actinomycetota bacterium]|nr:hypothetical protein [Actinomycetota bacterium]